MTLDSPLVVFLAPELSFIVRLVDQEHISVRIIHKYHPALGQMPAAAFTAHGQRMEAESGIRHVHTGSRQTRHIHMESGRQVLSPYHKTRYITQILKSLSLCIADQALSSLRAEEDPLCVCRMMTPRHPGQWYQKTQQYSIRVPWAQQ